MCAVHALCPPCRGGLFQNIECEASATEKLGFVKFLRFNAVGLGRCRKSFLKLKPIKAKEDHGASLVDDGNGSPKYHGISVNNRNCVNNEPESSLTNHSAAFSGTVFICCC